MTTAKILIRCSGRADVVLDLRPGLMVPVNLRPGIHGHFAPFSVLLLETDGIDVTPAGIQVSTADSTQIEQPALIDTAGHAESAAEDSETRSPGMESHRGCATAQQRVERIPTL
ncbi:hypothetical protein J2S43_007877 [Catenuloplanes nepalensis]|uniref:Uncharacterized protein n=1 Tax=Catenuloplanes nepalensis TaxID=587533 RepID=A0ABT9N733_9ACTN|nr:hypothetical protein [Catenuloplanes nepalensis]MDP9799365.1 hypothetical protein [Catenuloplanes nepalensis]